MKTKATAAAVYLCRTDVVAPACPSPRRRPPCSPSQCQMNPVSGAGPLSAVAAAVSGGRPLAGRHGGTSVKTISSRRRRSADSDASVRSPAPLPVSQLRPPPPSWVSMQLIPFILLSAHFNKPPRYVLPSPRPEGVMKGDWLIRGAGAMPPAGPTEQTDCNNPPPHFLFNTGSTLISGFWVKTSASADVSEANSRHRRTELPASLEIWSILPSVCFKRLPSRLKLGRRPAALNFSLYRHSAAAQEMHPFARYRANPKGPFYVGGEGEWIWKMLI